MNNNFNDYEYVIASTIYLYRVFSNLKRRRRIQFKI